jgi:hypothetical protein
LDAENVDLDGENVDLDGENVDLIFFLVGEIDLDGENVIDDVFFGERVNLIFIGDDFVFFVELIGDKVFMIFIGEVLD